MVNIIPLPQNIQAYLNAQMIALCMLLCLGSSASFAAQLSASVDKQRLGLDSSLTLSLSFNEQLQDGASPDLSALEKDFNIINTQQSNRVSIVNGQRSATTQWHIILVPLRSGQLEIPALTLDNYKSQAITITVDDQASSPNSDEPKAVYFETSVDTDETYVQAQIVYTRKLFYSIALEGNLPELEIPQAVTKRIGDAKTYETVVQGSRYNVNETRYAIYPQTSGNLEIPAQVFQGYTRGRSIWDNRQSVIARTQSHVINIKPKPANYPKDAAWLPAKSLSAMEQWSSAPSKATQGEPITRTITLRAEGLSAAQLPPISLPDQTELKIYPDQSENHDEVTGGNIVGVREENFAIMPIVSGKVNLPDIKVTWWNTELDKLEETVIPRAELLVEANAQAVLPQIPLSPSSTAKQVPSSNSVQTNNNSLDNASTLAQTPEASTSKVWMLLCILLLISNLVMAGIWWYQTQYKSQLKTRSEPSNDNNEPKAFKQLQQALDTQDLLATKQSIIKWGRAYWQDNSISQLSQVINKIEDASCQNNLKVLNKALYSNQGVQWSNEDCKNLLASYRHQSNQTTPKMHSSLPSLYPAS